ncbi:trypsin-like serine peptidase [Cystobacter ferrugineus]|uniref:Serine protease n=1 Tax=Cystobacter ferrugineus TaxID=83449 RepID=A0A1L9B4W3_9BACT|nr:serine protease [Cystobacter ferrugineus]OJH37292.1 serine protease [Cystobacter ferrugineus]
MKHLEFGLPVRPFMGALMCTLSLAVGCGSVEELEAERGALGKNQGKVVYGTDDRTDVYVHPDATLRARAQQSTVGLVHPEFINLTDPNNVTFPGPTLGEGLNLCTTERFWNDRRAAFCSGSLIGDDLVLTAGHCVGNAAECANTRIVFNYYRSGEGEMQRVTSADVFQCASIVARQHGNRLDEQYLDYAIVRLDRPATPRFTPAPVRTGNTPLSVGQNVAAIGSSNGIPFKIDSGGSVRDTRAGSLDFFVATSDTFAGNSGSAVYETNSYSVAGIIVRGDADYVANGTCKVVNRCGETECFGTEATYIYPALRGLCAEINNSDPRLCAGMPPPPVRPANSFTYSTSDTNNGQKNTVDKVITLGKGDVVQVGTCGLEGATENGPTSLRLVNAAGVQVANGGCSFKHRATESGDYTIRAGCSSSWSCGGTVVWKQTLNANLVRGTFNFNVSNTDSATRNTANQNVTLSYGQTIDFGTCGTDGTVPGNGDTVMRLVDVASGSVVVEHDDAHGDCGSLSHAIYTSNIVGDNRPHQIRIGCFRDTQCSGTAAYVIY